VRGKGACAGARSQLETRERERFARRVVMEEEVLRGSSPETVVRERRGRRRWQATARFEVMGSGKPDGQQPEDAGLLSVLRRAGGCVWCRRRRTGWHWQRFGSRDERDGHRFHISLGHAQQLARPAAMAGG
jgi:hypothetical protein